MKYDLALSSSSYRMGNKGNESSPPPPKKIISWPNWPKEMKTISEIYIWLRTYIKWYKNGKLISLTDSDETAELFKVQ